LIAFDAKGDTSAQRIKNRRYAWLESICGLRRTLTGVRTFATTRQALPTRPMGGDHTSDGSLKKMFVRVVPESLPATNRI
jgi:hypothetical protein